MDFKYDSFNEFDGDIIEIVPSDTSIGLLNMSGNKNIKIYIPLTLSIGILKNIQPFNNSFFISCYSNNNLCSFTCDYDKFESVVNNSTKRIRVWSSHLDSSDYCLLLFICSLFKNKNISVIFSEEYIWSATTLTNLDSKDIKKLEKKEHKLKKWQIDDYCNELNKIVEENKELRYMLNGTVVSCDADYFDKDIIDRLEKKGKIYIYEFVADLIGNPVIPYVRYSDWFYVNLIDKLEKNGIIKSYLVNDKKYIELVK